MLNLPHSPMLECRGTVNDLTIAIEKFTDIHKAIAKYSQIEPLDPITADFFSGTTVNQRWLVSEGAVVCRSVNSMYKAQAIYASGNQYVQYPADCLTLNERVEIASFNRERRLARIVLADNSVAYTMSDALMQEMTASKK